MNNKSLKLYISVVIVLITGIMLTAGGLNHQFANSPKETFILDHYSINGIPDDFGYRTLDYNNDKYYLVETTFKKEDVTHLIGNINVVIPRLSANWYKVKLNNHLLGIVGNPKNNASSIWNTVNSFSMDRDLIEDENTIRIEAYSEYKFGKSDLPIILATSSKSSKILTWSSILFLYTNYFFIGSLLSLSVFLILLYSRTKGFDSKELLLPLAVLLASIYFFDLTPVYYLYISLLSFRKIVFMSLYLSATLVSFALSNIFDRKILKQLGILLVGLMVFAVLFSSDMITFKKYYNRLNIFLLINIASWLIVAIQDRNKHKDLSQHVLVSCVILVIPSFYEAVNMLLGYDSLVRTGAYGVYGFALGLLLLSISRYLEFERTLYREHKSLKHEADRLNKILIYDENTELYNHRYFYKKYEELIIGGIKAFGILYIKLDKFNLINEMYSHETGDQILNHFSKHLKTFKSHALDIFRYSGEEFILISDAIDREELVGLATQIKDTFTTQSDINELAGFLPVTLSIGIASFPKDTFDLKTLVDCAEKATKYSKSVGGNKITVYDTALNTLIASDSEQLNRGLLSDFVYALASTVDQRESYNGKHSDQVCSIAMILADKLNLDEDLKHSLMLGGLLHDLGKLGIAESLLKKPGQLTRDEMEIIKNHPIYGYNISKQFIYDQDILACIKHHHERFDGTGYPDGLSGEDIPLLARIISISDAYHAMTSDRPYRQALKPEMVISELHKSKGTQFDPIITDLLIDHLL